MQFSIPMIWRGTLEIIVKIAIFVSSKQRVFFFNQRDKITYSNLDSVRTAVPHDELMPPPVPFQHGRDATDSSADEDNLTD